MSRSPSVAQEACPTWCVADHTNQVHPDDVRHWGDLGTVAAVEILAQDDGSDLRGRNLQIDIGIERDLGANVNTTHVSLAIDERGDRSLVITADSALRLSQALARAAAAGRV